MSVVRPLFAAAFVVFAAGTAAAQDAGGIGFPNGISPANIAQAFSQPARLPAQVFNPHRGAPPGAMVTDPTVSRSQVHQKMITKIRGDAGFLAGFSHGQPLAASRQPPPEFAPPLTIIEAPFIFNNINSDLSLGTGGPGGGTGGGTGGTAPAPADPATTALNRLSNAITTGGVTFNNVNSAVNIAAGTGNTAVQTVTTRQR